MQLYLLLNTDCNLNCGFCIRGKNSRCNYIDVDDLGNVLQKNDFSKYHLVLTGGEPTLHPHLPDIVSLCQPRFNGITVCSNGVNSSWIEKCKDKHFHVQISLDGTADLHNRLRGDGKQDVINRILCSIERITSYNISYNISTTVGQFNYDNVKDLCKHIEELPNLKYWKVSPVLPFGCADENDCVSINQWNNLVNFLVDNSHVRLYIQRLFDFNLLERYFEKHCASISFPKSNCGDVKSKVYVYPDFTVYPCTCLTDFPLGNLVASSLVEIIQNDKSKRFSAYQVKSDTLCSTCKYLPVCNGGCIGMSYHFYHELGRGDYRCPLIQAQLPTTL